MFKSLWRAARLWLEHRRLNKIVRKKARTNKEVVRLHNTANTISGVSVGGWGYSEEAIKNTLDIGEIKDALRELADYKQREIEEQIKWEKENERVI
ncbi:hypothetical protein pVa21_143 [Vibrio phage pVa-21]|nr:hypothetical protein pVa21_143 [Vibrio phage pVa-21]